MSSPQSIMVPLCVYFAANPEECLLSTDACHKLGVSRPAMWNAVYALERDGYVAVDRAVRPMRISAGPALLKLIGRSQ